MDPIRSISRVRVFEIESEVRRELPLTISERTETEARIGKRTRKAENEQTTVLRFIQLDAWRNGTRGERENCSTRDLSLGERGNQRNSNFEKVRLLRARLRSFLFGPRGPFCLFDYPSR